MDPMEEIRALFLVECEEHLEALHEGLAVLKATPGDAEMVNTVFRAVHSVKGGAAAFALGDLVDFAHGFESALDGMRGGRIVVSPGVLSELIRSTDLLADLIAAARSGASGDKARIAEQLARLEALAARPSPQGLSVRFRPFPTLFERGHEPAILLRELARLGPVQVTCNVRLVPGLEDLDPEGAYLAWAIEAFPAGGEPAVREVFEFAEDDCELSVEVLAAPGALASDATVAPAPCPVPATPPEEMQSAAPPVPGLPPADAPPAPPRQEAAGSPTVRVDLARVDRLINLVGELVISQAMLSQSVADGGAAVAEGLESLGKLTREIQESVLAIRAQPVKPLFHRMARVVREAGDAVGKPVELVTAGELTEVDKTVIERLADPLTHMIRNAVDHGIERPDARRAAGKPEMGTVRLSAEHRSGRVLIEIADDGAGIDRERVRAIAVERGLIAADAALSEAEIDGLLFVPGFSTASAVSDLSGRGVGMDVVKRSIVGLGGRISTASIPGRGTTFSISLPLTLAILDGMVVRAGGETVVVPLAVIFEMLKPEPGQLHRIGDRGLVVQVRGEILPVVDVAERLGFPQRTPGDEGVMLVIETSAGDRRALLVDAIEEQRQVVMKGLGAAYAAVRGIAAATILGNGRVALILDTDALVEWAGPATLALAG